MRGAHTPDARTARERAKERERETRMAMMTMGRFSKQVPKKERTRERGARACEHTPKRWSLYLLCVSGGDREPDASGGGGARGDRVDRVAAVVVRDREGGAGRTVPRRRRNDDAKRVRATRNSVRGHTTQPRRRIFPFSRDTNRIVFHTGWTRCIFRTGRS